MVGRPPAVEEIGIGAGDDAPPSTRSAASDRVAAFSGARHGAQCEVCGNDYDLASEVITAGNRQVFDSFECAIHKLAPVCDHCGRRIIGHGVEANGTFFCSANRARLAGVAAVVDHV